MTLKTIFYILFFITFISCSKNDSSFQKSYSNNLECFGCWRNQNTLTKEIAHSGSYSSRLDSISQYSVTFEIPIKEINVKPLKKAVVIFWVYFLEEGTQSDLAVQTTFKGETKFWIGQKLENKVKKIKEWTKVGFSVTLPANIESMDNLGVYVMNHNKKVLFIDDFDISFE